MSKKRSKRRWYQYRLRTLLGIVAIAAVGLGGWQYWTIVRPMRELDRLLSESTCFSSTEKLLLRKLAWNRSAWRSGLIDELGLRRADLMKSGWPFVWHHIIWSGNFVDVDGSTYRVFLFDRLPLSSYAAHPVICVVTDDGHRPKAWTVVGDGAVSCGKAPIESERPLVLQIVCASGRLDPRRATYRYHISPDSIEQLGGPSFEPFSIPTEDLMEYLNLEETQVTPEGVKKLQEALPECEIVY